MRSVKLTLWTVTVCLCFIILFLYHFYHSPLTHNHRQSNEFLSKYSSSTKKNVDIPMKHIPFNELYKDLTNRDEDNHDKDFSIEFEENRPAHFIDTPGCRIPVAMVNYRKSLLSMKTVSCGFRAIYFRRIDKDNVRVTIKEKSLRKVLRNNTSYRCCYRFFQGRSNDRSNKFKLRYTTCTNIINGDTVFLKSDFINVQCFEKVNHNKTQIVYDDIYGFCKKNNDSNVVRSKCKEKYNVLVIGMDSMSLSRFVQTMTRTVNYLKDNFWPGFRGYHKVGDNTFPNLMAILTGNNKSTISKKCSGKMDNCNDLFIWNIFKAAGYATAYGEDYLKLPDVFSKNYSFHASPTDHYLRPFFLKGENEMHNRSIVCAGKIPSGQQLLDFAVDFALTYRNDPFFGFFWMNSFSHNINNRPQYVDKIFENFLNRLSYIGTLQDTFIILLSDHGIRFGEDRLSVESYYDDRMPFLFVWVPSIFEVNHPSKVKSLLINQFRLVTPYDIFDTLLEINHISRCMKTEEPKSSKHQSIFRSVSVNRTCQDVGIHDKWCSCHKLYPLGVEDTEGIKSVHYVASYIKSYIETIQTKRCWTCLDLSLKNVSRIHFYYDNDKVNLYYLVAFSMQPRNIYYEATVIRKDVKLEIVGPISIISQYKGFGDCTIRREDKIFCVCQRVNNCRSI